MMEDSFQIDIKRVLHDFVRHNSIFSVAIGIFFSHKTKQNLKFLKVEATQKSSIHKKQLYM